MSKTQDLMAFVREHAQGAEARRLSNLAIGPATNLLRAFEWMEEALSSPRQPVTEDSLQALKAALAIIYGKAVARTTIIHLDESAEHVPETAGDEWLSTTLRGHRLSALLLGSLAEGPSRLLWKGLTDLTDRCSYGRPFLIKSEARDVLARVSLHLYLGFAMAGDRENKELMSPIIEALDNGLLPLGWMKDEPDTFIIVV